MKKYAGNYVDEESPPSADTFEIGLVLAGAVSAGAYEAGVLDYLIEALDAWEAAKARVKGTLEEGKVPQHNVVIKVVTAASAGSMSAALMAVAARYKFKHVGSQELGVEGYAKVPPTERQKIDEVGSKNPFFKAWVQDISIEKLLTTNDLNKSNAVLQSLLDSTALLDITRECLRFRGEGVANRGYFASPTRFIFSVCNLRGIPYFLQLSGRDDVGLGMSVHKDYRSFTISYSPDEIGAQKKRADDIALSWNGNTGHEIDNNWKVFGVTAIASGAFPVGLAPQPMSRDITDYSYRFIILPSNKKGEFKVEQLKPHIKRLGSSPFNSFLIDGGTMNNEPVGLARQELAGLVGRNERDGECAKRAILMIDPFPDCSGQEEKEYPGTSPALVKAFFSLLSAWKNQSRFSPEDIALAANEGVYSRFLIAPSRGIENTDKPTLACGALGGFAGFFSRDYRQHDYLLGRRNAQKFLSDVFTLPIKNSLFNERLSDNEKIKGAKWVRSDSHGVLHLPIIPLVDELMPGIFSGGKTSGRMEDLSAWPENTFDINSIEASLKRRLDKIVSHAIKSSSMGWFRQVSSKILALILRGFIYKKIKKAILDGLADGGLMPKSQGNKKGDADNYQPWFKDLYNDF
ncbi:patatin [Azotobacter chroococcum]|uniref:Putative patatin n=1 Tax=Azotobacter chroococcum NCIMB 8003 TaxID=1328314 RepID=A0A0C4WS46_9GAMM|nr:patatin [Azotobacter chroococcum]AJE23546.1 putative patatin [Azotobacter chroococcum NCIMB 8003]